MLDEQKKSDTLIMTTLSRGKFGFNLRIKTHSIVEEFMRNLGGGNNIVNVTNYGRQWEPTGIDAKELFAYWLPDDLTGPLPTDSTKLFYRLDRLGLPLLIDDGGRIPVINLSFLRLVGIGDGDGVTFKVGGVSSREGIRDLAQQIKLAHRAFNLAYMKPITVNVTMSSTEISY